MRQRLTLLTFGIVWLAGCVKEPPPRSVSELLENPILLEAAMVRCSQDRDATRYDAECINAREAVSRIEAQEEAARKAEHEARSASKRQALRRTQEAAAAARRRAAKQRREREEAEYLAQFGVPLSSATDTDGAAESGGSAQDSMSDGDPAMGSASNNGGILPATDGGNAPVMEAEPETDAATDLDSIREELRRRSDGDSDGN